LKHDSGFGVTWLREGTETHVPETAVDKRLAQVGTYARIVDWDSLANGLLGVTIEGDKKFRLISSYQRPDNLHMADVEWVEQEPFEPLPNNSEGLADLLSQLLDHPHIARLKLNPEVHDASSLSCLLAQLLPIEERFKFMLLALTDPLNRLEKLTELLDEYRQ
jgi:Lon protease-like protein